MISEMSEAPPSPAGADPVQPEAGFAHVAVLAFVAARVVPSFGFPISLVGGTGIAHATDRLGARRGLAAGVAAAIESVAILGPARMSGPGGQLATAPAIGILHARGQGRAVQIAVCAAIRAVFNVLTTLVFVVIIAGGIDTYVGAYDATVGLIPGAPDGEAAALVATLAGIAIWSLGASTVQVLVFERAQRRWLSNGGIEPGAGIPATEAAVDAGEGAPDPEADAEEPELHLPSTLPASARRFDPRAVTAAAAVAFLLLLLSTEPLLLGAVALWLLIAWQLAPAEREVLRPGLFLAGTVAIGAFVANVIGGEGVDDGLEHAARATLLVMTATWMRGAAGTEGVREVVRRVLTRMGRFRAAGELQASLDSIAGERRMEAAVRDLVADVRRAEGELVRMLDAAIGWVSREASRFRPGVSPPSPDLRYGPLDLLILLGAALPAIALASG